MSEQMQKQYFIDGEGDAWFERNKENVDNDMSNWLETDYLTKLLMEIPLPQGKEVTVVEVGCGQGLRLSYLKQERNWKTIGIDPSSQSIEYIKGKGSEGYIATADNLPLKDKSVDLLIYGFCLYVCDIDDLFRIASEAHRVLKKSSWLAILDFWLPHHKVNNYKHLEGVKSYKGDIPAMFDWHPSYVITNHTVRHHEDGRYTDEKDEWVGVTLIRRHDKMENP